LDEPCFVKAIHTPQQRSEETVLFHTCKNELFSRSLLWRVGRFYRIRTYAKLLYLLVNNPRIMWFLLNTADLMHAIIILYVCGDLWSSVPFCTAE
jgi:hypothetical protein